MSEPAIAWRRVDDYCWVGPPGWTICRVWLDGSYAVRAVVQPR